MRVPLVLSLVVLYCQAASADVRTFGESGPVCTRNGKRCITQARCDNTTHHCVCPAGHKGDGTIECIREDQELCLSISDPHVRTFGGAAATLALPCRHRLTRFTTPNKAGKTGSAICSFEVFGVSIMTTDGRFYERQMEISLAVGDFVDQVFVQVDIKKMGINQQNVFDFFFNNKGQLTPWGSTVHETWNGVHIFCTFDFENNFAILEVSECDVRFKFRPHNSTVSALSSQIPGITITIPQNASFTSQHGGFPASLCGTPEDDQNLYKVNAAELGFTDLTTLLTYQFLTSGVHQNVDDDYHVECMNSMSILKACSDQVKAIKMCGSLFEQKKTLKCLLSKDLNPMSTFMNCLGSICTSTRSVCELFLEEVRGCPTSKLIEEHSC